LGEFLKNKKMSIGKMVCGALAGFAAGIIAGILFAPEKGADARYRFMIMGDTCIKQIKTRLDEPVRAIAEIYSGIVHLTEALANIGKDTSDEPIKRI